MSETKDVFAAIMGDEKSEKEESDHNSTETNKGSGESKQVSYTDRLIKHLCENLDDNELTIANVVKSIKVFAKKYNSQLRKQQKGKKKEKDNSVLYFGKYKGKKIEDIASFDASYLLWLSRQSFINQNLKKTIEEAIPKKNLKN